MTDYNITVNGVERSVKVDNDKYTMNDIVYQPRITKLSDYSYLFELREKLFEITCNKISQDNFRLTLDGYSFVVVTKSSLEKIAGKLLDAKADSNKDLSVKTPMPGLLSKIFVKPGDVVEKGAPLFILEAMKMENIIKSNNSGHIENVYFEEGASLEKDTIVLTLQKII
ncbi:MAG: acetyl-CoA carboxylase biotin carboxyl carrier protein subunit [Bacteroidetes bacterium]|nr:acetyl-CoA carboxylase biotin carboxyl carrier protein subunit [Bacteroidota bacterium]